MRLGVLFSGGKDSTLALHKTAAEEEVTCLITLNSTNPESFMFHTPNINVSRLQAEALGLPLIERVTEGKAEKELDDLEEAINEAVREYALDGIVSGAIESVYQAERIQRVCNRLEVWSFNPLWKSNQVDLLREIVKRGFKVIISGIFAYPLDAGWLGRDLDESLIKELVALEVD
ncbi:diphthine--ammonia ligase [Candidatus Bathyarchaeota archaeon]|nr:diphthine--ammonia ligase [Candidatus Bathyarchaeota archaeon]